MTVPHWADRTYSCTSHISMYTLASKEVREVVADSDEVAEIIERYHKGGALKNKGARLRIAIGLTHLHEGAWEMMRPVWEEAHRLVEGGE